MKILTRVNTTSNDGIHKYVIVHLGDRDLWDIIEAREAIEKLHKHTRNLVPDGVHMFASSTISPYMSCPYVPDPNKEPGWLIRYRNELLEERQKDIDRGLQDPPVEPFAGGSIMVSDRYIVVHWHEKHINVFYETDPISIDNIMEVAGIAKHG